MTFLCDKHSMQGTIVAMAAKMPEVLLTEYGPLRVGVANDVIPLLGGKTCEFTGAYILHSCNCKRHPQMSVNLGRSSCPIVLSVSAAMKMSYHRIHLPSRSDIM